MLLGIVLLAILQNGLNLLGVSPYFFQIVIGLVILVSTTFTVLIRRGRKRAGGWPMAETLALDRFVASLRRGTPGGVAGLAALFALLVVGFASRCPASPAPAPLQSIMFQMPELGLLSLAMVVPLISGGLNLAIIATANQAALLMAGDA